MRMPLTCSVARCQHQGKPRALVHFVRAQMAECIPMEQRILDGIMNCAHLRYIIGLYLQTRVGQPLITMINDKMFQSNFCQCFIMFPLYHFLERQEEKIKSCEHLLETVARGARARATAATGVHAHSSRSHALLVVSVEHRWRDVGEADPSKYHTQVARLTLVDLAGAESMERSHGGKVDAAGVGTNMGLLVLGRVIKALAEGSERVPYRDSSLTRLMQSSLGGKAKTQMLACVSPVLTEAEVTLHTLKYASGARSVLLKPEAASIATAFDSDPMVTDVEDDDPALNRRCIWIETADFGDVFARCVGDPNDPLILYIHGSGPCNSSMMWNKLAVDVAMLASTGWEDD